MKIKDNIVIGAYHSLSSFHNMKKQSSSYFNDIAVIVTDTHIFMKNIINRLKFIQNNNERVNDAIRIPKCDDLMMK